MDFREFLRAIRKRWTIVLGFVVLGTGLGVLVTVTTTKVYQADVQIFVATSNTSSGTDLNQGNVFTQNQVQSYTSIANSPAVTIPVVKAGRLAITSQQLAAKISADAPVNKVLINLHVTDHNAERAAALANAVAAQFVKVVQQTEQTDAGGKPVVKLSVIHPATVPGTPVKPNAVLNIGLGFILGSLLGVGFVVLREVLDDTLNGPEDFEALGVPVLGIVPFDKRMARNLIAFRSDPHGTRAEAYRQLRTNLQFVNVDHAPRIIAITSGVPGEGKTTTAVNLAAALAEGGYRVCLVEADLRRPTIAKSLGLVGDVGFTTAIVGKVAVRDALQNAGRNLAVLTSGPIPPNPSELLISQQAAQVIREVSKYVDYTIIDTAPLLPVADGAEVAALADATLVVHHAGKSTRDQAVRSIEALGRVGEKPVGAILNMMSRRRGNYGDSYGYYYTYRPERSPRRKVSDGRWEPNAEVVPAETEPSSPAAVEQLRQQPMPDADGSGAERKPTAAQTATPGGETQANPRGATKMVNVQAFHEQGRASGDDH